MLNRDSILGATVKCETVEVPEWGGTVYVRALTALGKFQLGQLAKEALPDADADSPEKLVRVASLMLTLCLSDEDGTRILSPSDAPALELQDGDLINRLCAVVNRVNGLSAEAKEKTKKK